jgi:hypothetical protein
MTETGDPLLGIREAGPLMTASPRVSAGICDALPRDEFAVTTLLADVVAGTPQAVWVASDWKIRDLAAMLYAGRLVRLAMESGFCRVVRHGGDIVGAALWSLHSGVADGPSAAATREGCGAESLKGRWLQDRLEQFAEVHRPQGVVCQQLMLLGARPGLSGQRIGDSLLLDHHAVLHEIRAQTPTYAVVIDARVRTFLERHCYAAIGRAEPFPDGMPRWEMSAMWRPAQPANLYPTGPP